MSEYNQAPLFKEFVYLYKGAGRIRKNAHKINQFLAKLIEVVPPDQLILIDGNYTTLLHLFVHFPQIDYKLLFQSDKPIDCNVLNANKRSPLHEGCITEKPNEGAMRLLEHGANVNLLGQLYSVPCHPLEIIYNRYDFRERPEIFRLLVEFNANVNYQDSRGRNLLHNALAQNKLAIVGFLITSGCDYNLKDHSGKTPIDLIRDARVKKSVDEYIDLINCR